MKPFIFPIKTDQIISLFFCLNRSTIPKFSEISPFKDKIPNQFFFLIENSMKLKNKEKYYFAINFKLSKTH